uniref:BRO1 domain-containing protein n=2 Tax=Physcomitrium patens TaxID=3218 RepID=A9TXQ4_PHYPA|nr:hypothetical protein PHYPA_011557 [Physcomitrium patens]
MQKPLRNYILQHYSAREAQEMEEDIVEVTSMRSEVERSTDASEARRDLLQRYFRALCVMESRFPISSEREHINTLHFTWYDAFRQGRKVSQQNIHFEKAAIAFNLGAVQSQIALSADRTTPMGLKQACGAFQAAAGVFAFLRDNISMKAAGTGNNSTIDISVECAGMLERLMLAQAQECFFEKVVADNKSLLCSKVAKQVGTFYEEACAALLLPPLNQHMDRTWVAHVQLKAAQFNAEAYYRAALDLHDKDDIPEEIARLRVGSSIIAEGRKQAKGAVVGPLQDVVTKLEMNINRNLDRANKENDRVYLMRVPSPDSLPPLVGAALAKSTPAVDVLDATKEKMFAGLVPDSSAKALSKYTEMVDDIVRTLAERLQQESEIMRVKLKEMNLPDSLRALEGSTSLPDDLRDDVEAVQIDGGPAGLETEMKQLRDLRRVNEELLAQVEKQLEKEATEDAQNRAQFGTRWTRPQSSTLTKTLHERANRFAVNLKQAGDSDARIDRTIRDNMHIMGILDTKPIESALPTLGRPMLSLDGNEDQIVGALRQNLSELEQCASQRAGLEDMLKEMRRNDNILPKLMTTSGSYEDLFKKEIGKYDLVSQEISRNIEDQDRLFQQIKMHNEAFSSVFNLEDFKLQQEKAYNQVRAAVQKYREVRENINEGLKFYATLQAAITNLKQHCNDYVMTRSIQCREMMDDIQRKIAGLSLTNNNRHSAPPTSHGSQDSSYYHPTASGPAPGYAGQPPAPPYYAGHSLPGIPPYYSQPPVHAQSQHPAHNSNQPHSGWQGQPAPQAPAAQPGAAAQPPPNASVGGLLSQIYRHWGL